MTGASDPSSTLFGVARGLDRDELLDVEDFLREVWTNQYGRPPSTLSADLTRMRELFKAGASAKRLREVVTRLSSLSRRGPVLPAAVYIVIDERRGLITPEGRVVLEELLALRENDQQVIDRDGMLRATRVVADAYGTWHREWLQKQLSGAGLRPGSYGFVLLLLINGSTAPDTALRVPAASGEERQLAKEIVPVVDAFATRIGGNKTPAKEAARLRSNWRVTEARRQLFDYVLREDRDGDAFFWVDRYEDAINAVAERLASRSDLSLDVLEDAFVALRDAYAKARPALSAWGAAHDRRANTAHVMERLIDRFVNARAAS